MPLMKTFSRPEISGWKPAPSSISADTRPFTWTVPDVGLPMPAISFSIVLLPEPLRPTMPKVLPGATSNDTPFSASNTSSGCRSLQDAPGQQRALQRRELLAPAVAAIDLADVADFDGVHR